MSLNPQQQLAVDTTEGAVLVIAGAGSGKTKVLTERIALIKQKGADSSEILAVTFTNKAAKEMRERIANIIGHKNADALWMSTFHSMCVRILRRYGHLLNFIHERMNQNFTIYDESDAKSVLNDILKGMGLDTKKVTPKEMKDYISALKNEMIDVQTFRTGKPSNELINWEKAYDILNKGIPKDQKKRILEVYTRYQEYLSKSNAMDFDDLILNTIHLFRHHPEALKYYQHKLRYIMVDEYQDTNHTQYVLINLLAAYHRNICVVGDDSQLIYGWRGADIKKILEEFEKDYPEVKLILLEQNYRCGDKILKAANQVISHNRFQRKKTLFTNKQDGEYIRYYFAMNQYDEARYVANEIQKIERENNNFSYKNCAVLFRTNSQSRAFEEAFMRASIPYQMIGGLKFFSRAEIKDIIAYLQFIQNPSDTVSFDRIINVPRRGIGPKTVKKIISESESRPLLEVLKDGGFKGKTKEAIDSFVNLIEQYQGQTDSLLIGDFLSQVLVDTGYLTMLESSKDAKAEERLENISELVNIAVEMQNETESTLADFLEHVSLHSDIDDATDENAVKIMTLHSAKGLEFGAVFLVGMEEGIFPHQRSLSSGDLEEERRLAYVGITRAMHYLYLTSAKRREQWGKSEENMPSRFLYEFSEDLIHPDCSLVKLDA